MNALKTREAGCKSEYELTVFFFISLDMYKPLFTLKNKLIMISITYGRDWSLLVMMNFYIRHNSMRRWNCMRVKNMISKNCISEKKYLFLTILRSFRFFENKWKTLFDMIIFLFMVWTLFPCTSSIDTSSTAHTVTESYIRQNDINHIRKKITFVFSMIPCRIGID